jgi:hypothetical protein
VRAADETRISDTLSEEKPSWLSPFSTVEVHGLA